MITLVFCPPPNPPGPADAPQQSRRGKGWPFWRFVAMGVVATALYWICGFLGMWAGMIFGRMP